MLKIEYLVLIDSKNSFCKTAKAFKSFLQSDSEIIINSGHILFKGIEFKYKLQESGNSNDNNKFFNIEIFSTEDNLVAFSELARSVKKILHVNQENSIQILWDDISFYYSSRGYPIVHEVENLMRKLITKFMLTTVGLGWTKETIPEGLKKSSRAEKVEKNNNYLYETDFIQLSSFLFDEYRTLDMEGLIKKISKINTSMVLVSDIIDFIPKSNWERYFQERVDCEGEYLKSRWDKLYQLRCKIAHNNSFTKADFESIEKIANEVKSKLNDAITALDKIHVTEEDREDLAESVAINFNAAIGSFIQKWRLLESISFELLLKKGLLTQDLSKREKTHLYRHRTLLIENKLISADVFKSMQNLNKVRNIIVHEHERDSYFTDVEINSFSKELDSVISAVSEKLLEC